MTTTELPLILQPEELDAHRADAGLRIVDLSNPAVFAHRHIPGAVPLDYTQLNASRPPVMGLLPPEAVLARLLAGAGITPDTHVVAYDSENGLKACRFLWTLDVIGHARFSLLNGGLPAWVEEQRELASGPVTGPADTPDYPVRYSDTHCADKAYILAHLGDPSVIVLDTRSAAEYHGIDRRAQRAGHIPGAVNIEWSQAVVGNGDMRLRPAEALRALYEGAGVTPDKEVIVHCQTHQRSSHTYIVLKSLGYPRLKGYPGSWSDWGNDPDTPIEQS